MYTELKTYQFIISMLKKYGIKNMVLSAGSRNVPFVHSVEKDSYFNCYSVVDERSAGYFALGMAQETNEPVLISCTASTASCNYYPPVAEAYYQNVPMIILTSDRDPRMLGQREDQMIDQVNMFDRHVKKSVNLPLINCKADEEYCIRLINEAFLELNHNGECGPIHINVPMDSYNKSFTAKSLPDVNVIKRIAVNEKDKWKEKADALLDSRKVMVVCGQKSFIPKGLNKALEEFFKKYNCVIVTDHMSNVNLKQGINTVLTFDENYISSDVLKELAPDIVISFGGQVFSGLKNQLRKIHTSFKHWLISERGEVCDLFKGLDTIFECSPEYFFSEMNSRADSYNNDMQYYESVKTYTDNVDFSNIPYSNVYAVKNIAEQIPPNSILHLSINDSIRITNFFNIHPDIKVYSNIGTYGIDGCMSSFIGQSVASPEKPAFLIIGDLSFFYDMNSLKINSLGKNAHILLLNNHGAAEFHYNGTWIDEASDLHTSARHNVKAEGWIKENSIKYLSASTKEEYDAKVKEFLYSDEAVVFEVFTEMSTDAEVIHQIYKENRPSDLKANLLRSTKEIVKKRIGQEKAKKILGVIKGD